MDYELIIRPEAKSDMLDIFRWYQEQREGLGYDFKLCVDEVLSKVQRHPLNRKKIYRDIRRVVTKRFPFGIFYVVENNKIIVLAVLHARRDPSKWKRRI